MSPGEELWGHFNAINDRQVTNFVILIIMTILTSTIFTVERLARIIVSDGFYDHGFAGPEFKARHISRKMGSLPQGDRGPYEGKGTLC